jgi:hypothetical protein
METPEDEILFIGRWRTRLECVQRLLKSPERKRSTLGADHREGLIFVVHQSGASATFHGFRSRTQDTFEILRGY